MAETNELDQPCRKEVRDILLGIKFAVTKEQIEATPKIVDIILKSIEITQDNDSYFSGLWCRLKEVDQKQPLASDHKAPCAANHKRIEGLSTRRPGTPHDGDASKFPLELGCHLERGFGMPLPSRLQVGGKATAVKRSNVTCA